MCKLLEAVDGSHQPWLLPHLQGVLLHGVPCSGCSDACIYLLKDNKAHTRTIHGAEGVHRMYPASLLRNLAPMFPFCCLRDCVCMSHAFPLHSPP
jgi:hypothetical protein